MTLVSPSSRYRARIMGCTYDERQIAAVLPSDQANELGVRDDLPLLLRRFAHVGEHGAAGLERDVTLPHGGHAVAAILALVLLRAGPKQALADEPQRDRADRFAGEIAPV